MSDGAVEPAPQHAPRHGEEAGSDMGDVLASDAAVPLLVEPDQGWIVDDEPTLVASEAGGETGFLSPEEAAINVISEDEAPGLNWDDGPGYVDESTI